MSSSKAKAKVKGTDTGTARLLELRELIRRRNPRTVRQEAWRYKRIKGGWTKPKGIDSKMRKSVKGWPKSPNIGRRGPVAARGLHPSGYREVLVHTVQEFSGLDPQSVAIRMGSTVGARARGAILSRAKELGFRILNPRGIRRMEKASASV